jgi:sarcosine/dimethylglycine N-methyltransferase
MSITQGTQYSTGLSQPNIERALLAAGKDLEHLVPADLALVEDFHTMGRIATAALVDLAEITSGSAVLDAGSGVGGTARYVADRFGATVTAVDLTGEYCETHRWLNRLVGLDHRISVHQGDVTALPFADAGFDVALSQHVQMNVADKARLYSEARRVLVPGGRLALWDITIGDGRELTFPLPWADQPAHSHLVAIMTALLAQPAGPLGLQTFVADFARKAHNLTAALSDGRLRVIQGIARAEG